jgi:hypothetical protein
MIKWELDKTMYNADGILNEQMDVLLSLKSIKRRGWLVMVAGVAFGDGFAYLNYLEEVVE